MPDSENFEELRLADGVGPPNVNRFRIYFAVWGNGRDAPETAPRSC